MPLNRRMDKEAVIHAHSGTLLSRRKECICLSLNKAKTLETITQSESRQEEEDKDRVPDIVQEVAIKTTPERKKGKKAKGLSEEHLQIAEERREATGKGERKRTPIWTQSSKEQQEEIRKPS